MSSPLLILGTGEDQLPVYREATRRGLRTIGVDRSSSGPGGPVADEFLQISTHDGEAIAAALAGRTIAGVATAASDACLASVVTLTERFGVRRWLSATAAAASMDKALFRRMMADAGIGGPAWVAGDDAGYLIAAAGRLRLPVVTKPVDASGSHGAGLVTTPAELPDAIHVAVDASPTGTAIVEEFIAGRNLTVELFLLDGRIRLCVISEKQLSGSGFVIAGHCCPAELSALARQRLVAASAAVAKAMEVCDGPLNLDFILTPGGEPIVLEAGARLCGNGFPLLVKAMRGVDTVRALVSLSLGEPVDLEPAMDRFGLLQVIASPLAEPATLVSVNGVAVARELPGVAFAEVYPQPGDVIHPFTRSGHKLGYVGVAGDTAAAADQTLRAALALIEIDLAP
ncbi:ATP-grasp domain-containing protein [Kribbella deserti]|uniref:ATP-grasp domain-containing protein n=1 Tax=Kribbella deserti TaxID=1926257 RepID=A0ABV6QFE4_9ACTN